MAKVLEQWYLKYYHSTLIKIFDKANALTPDVLATIKHVCNIDAEIIKLLGLYVC